MKTIIKTAGSFDKVLASCRSIGERYQPKAPALSITAMSELSDRSQQTMQAVIVTRSAYRLAVNNRRECFAGIPKLSVRIVRMLATLEASKEHLTDATSLKNSLQKKGKNEKSVSNVNAAEASAPARRAASRHHYQMQMETFASLVKIVEDMGTYYPNENDVTLPALKTKLAELQSKSHAVNIAAVAFDKARRERKQVIFGPQGVDKTIRGVEDYIRGAFGTGSPEFYQMIKAD